MKMKEIILDTKKLDSSLQSILAEGVAQFNRGDYQQAYNHFQSALDTGNKIKNLRLMAGNCLLKLGQNRLARLYIFREALNYPENQIAQNILLAQYEKVNGKITSYKSYATKRVENPPSISLVMIVKNEEANLPRCLDSFKDIVQEIIVVDTGSTDRTVEIAKCYGARVEYFPWVDDFSAARNESLKYATCDWIMRIDADEYIEESEKIKLLDTICSGRADIYLCPMYSQIQGKENVVENVRLIKNHTGVKYEFPIHETVALNAIRLGLTQGITDVRIMHTGYTLQQEGWSEKLSRNIRICEKALEKDPKNYYVRLIKGCLIVDKNPREAIPDFEEGIKNLPEDAIGLKYLGMAYCVLVNEYLKEKKDVALFDILMNIQIDFLAIQSMMQFLADFYLYQLCDLKTAEQLYVWASHRDPSLIFADLLTPDLYNKETIQQRLVEVSILDHHRQKAVEFLHDIYPETLSTKGKPVKNQRLRDIAELSDDDIVIREMERTRNWSSESLRRLAKAYKNKSDWQKAYTTLIHAAVLSEISAQDYFDLAVDQIQLNHLVFAQTLINEGKKLDPESAPSANSEAFLAVKENNFEKALEKAVEAFIKAPNSSGYQSNVEQIAARLQLTPVEALKETGMKWINNGQIKNGIFTLMMYSRFQPGDADVKEILLHYAKA